MTAIQYVNGTLCIEQVELQAIAARHGTPCYVYSRAAIEHAWHGFDQAFGSQPHLVCYAVKANGTLAVLQLLARLGSGFDIVSGGELERVLAAGAEASKVVFSGVGKGAEEIRRALSAGIRSFNVESRSELHRLDAIAGERGTRAPVALRINPDVDASTHPHIATGLKESKFGIPHEDAIAAFAEATALPNLEVRGIAFHIGSQITMLDPFLHAVDRIAVLLKKLRSGGLRLAHVDLGGGMAIRYRDEQPPDPAVLVNSLKERINDPEVELMLEPGRSIVGNAGVLLTRVEYLKQNGEQHFAIVDAGMNDLMRPALYGAWHDIRPVAERSVGAERDYAIAGPVCESADVFGRGRRLRIAEGELLAICSTGAYSASMASQYNSRPRAPEILVDGTAAVEIRRRETVADLLRGESLL